MARKRDLAFQERELMVEQAYHPTGALQNSREYWNSNAWNWDCSRFVAQRVDGNAMDLDVPAVNVRGFEMRSGEERVAGEDDDASLCLKLGSGSGGLSNSDEGTVRPNKRVAGSLPCGNGVKIIGGGGNGNHPTCQVDSCMVDLSNGKDYHRRHKVCEAHSKATLALVGKQKQRFCQQCSRFHMLSEFDEGKRSCRRRLAGHNRRRRKQQPDDVTSRSLPASGQENAVNTDFDLVSLLAALARTQANQDIIEGAPASVPDKEQLIKLISKINSIPPPTDATTKLPTADNLEKTSQASPEHQSRISMNSSSQSTLNLLGVHSSVSVPQEFVIPVQRSSHSSDSEKTKSADNDQPDPRIWKQQTTLDLSSTGGERSSNSCHHPSNDSNSHVHDTQVNIPLQLFCSSPEDNTSPPKMESSCKYFSSDGSNQNEDRSPSSSPGVELFPVKPPKQTMNQDTIRQTGNATRGSVSFDLFGGSNRCVEVDFFRGSPNHPENASPGSANSPSSSTSTAKDLTGRILFKLFDKDPSNLPAALRSEILTWLSNTPSQIESYIRPGCVVLSIYVSMPSASWEKLQRNLLEHVSNLLQNDDTNIWRDGRFLVQVGKQLASHNNGKLRLCKSWMTPKAPELISVSPLAIVGGRETIVHIRGRNFNSGTKIHSTYMGGYITKEVSGAEIQDSTCNGTRLCSCEIHIAAPSGVGRYFVEAENGFKGNSFPIIIADSAICKELRQLEFEFEEDSKLSDVISEEQEQDVLWPKTEVLHFLNELGWLFQMNRDPSNTLGYSIYRFKYLLTFSVEKDFTILVKKLLDTLVEEKMSSDGIPLEVSEMVSAIQLLHRAVRRKCKKMVEMLIHYSIVSHDAKPLTTYVFPPNLVGPGGLTPLHIAACTSGSEHIIDALTSDPLELGLSCWESQLDETGHSPYAYATSRNNHSYNKLVSQKLTDRTNNQISLSVHENRTMEQAWIEQPSPASNHHNPNHKKSTTSCSKCGIIASRSSRRILLPGSSNGMVARPFILSMLAIAAVCVCVCLYFRGHPYTGMDSPFTWEKLNYGTI